MIQAVVHKINNNRIPDVHQRVNHLKSLVRSHHGDDKLFEMVRDFMVEQGIDAFLNQRNDVIAKVHQACADVLIQHELSKHQLSVYETSIKKITKYLLDADSGPFSISMGGFWAFEHFDPYEKRHYDAMMLAASWSLPDFHIDKTVMSNGRNLLQDASFSLLSNDHGAVIKGLIDWCGADVHAFNSSDFKRPLHYMNIRQDPERYTEIMDVLLSRGANVHERLNFKTEIVGAMGGFKHVNYDSYINYVEKAHKHYSHHSFKSTDTCVVNAKANYTYLKKRLSADQALESTSENVSPARAHRKVL